MREFFITVALIWIISAGAIAQFDEVGVFMGVSNYAGDLTEKHFEPLEFNIAAGFFVRHNLKGPFALKLHLYRGVISGSDQNNSFQSDLWYRNLSFRSELYELGLQLEYNIFNWGNGKHKNSPYVFTGIAGFFFNPQAELDGKTYNLQTYKTENENYNLFSLGIPMGVGFRLDVNEKATLGFEIGLRKTFTDHLDDVSGSYPAYIGQSDIGSTAARLSYRIPELAPDAPLDPVGLGRGNPDSKDWYVFAGITISFYQGRKPFR